MRELNGPSRFPLSSLSDSALEVALQALGRKGGAGDATGEAGDAGGACDVGGVSGGNIVRFQYCVDLI